MIIEGNRLRSTIRPERRDKMEIDLAKIFGSFNFLLLDFDGCQADTFSPSPRKIDVSEAYSQSIKQIFGTKLIGEEPLAKIGGLQNRAPIEVIYALFSLGGTENLIQAAQNFLQQHSQELKRYVPANKGVPLEWDQDPIKVIAEILVRQKLSILMKEIGPDWPKPCAGFLGFYRALKELKTPIGISTISSGHDEFIKKTFKTWGCEPPAAMLTDDDLRNLYPNKPGPSKPDAILLDLTLINWLKLKGVTFEGQLLTDFLAVAKSQLVYFGDDQKKDGGLAKNAGVRFGWFNPQSQPAEGLGDYFSFANWQDVPKILGLE